MQFESPAPFESPRTFHRYVAIGDSQSEGLNDHDGQGGFRGWADRFAEHLAHRNPDLTYANLAVRGKLSGQIRAEQLEPALALGPDIVTVMAGLNDVLRKTFSLAQTADNLEAMVSALTASGAHVVINTFPNIGKVAPIAAKLMPRVGPLNQAIRDMGARHGATVVDFEGSEEAVDRRLWSEDRIHANAFGHERIAFAFAQQLGVAAHSEEDLAPLPELAPRSAAATAWSEVQFLRTFAVPWIVRRVRGRSSGDGISAKRPELTPVRSRSFS
jgi:lysophospholipase L1-like esterase